MSNAKQVIVGGVPISLKDEVARDSIGNLSNLNTTAKNNLVAAINEAAQSGGGEGSDPEAVKYTTQSLTVSQKAQARTNIGAGVVAVEYGATLQEAPCAPQCHLQLVPGSFPSGMSGWTFGKADLYLTLQNYSSTDDDSYYSGVFANPAAIEVSEGDDPNSDVDPGSENSGEEPYEEDDYSIENGGEVVENASGDTPVGDSARSLMVWAHWHNDGWECGFYEIRSSTQADWNAVSGPSAILNKPTIPDISGKQDTLVSGTNIKTINQNSLLGSGDLTIEDGVGFDSIETPQTADGTAIITLSNGDKVTVDLNHVHPQYYSKLVETSQPQGGFLPDVIYKLGTLTGSVTFALATAVTGNANHYFIVFDTGSTAPTITWPAGLTWADGSAPTVAASKHYEVSIMDGIAAYLEV